LRRDKTFVQSVNRRLRQGRCEITTERPTVPHDRSRWRPAIRCGPAVLDEPFCKQPGFSRSRRSHNHERTVANTAAVPQPGGHSCQGVVHQTVRYRKAGMECQLGQFVRSDRRHWQRPGRERGLHADVRINTQCDSLCWRPLGYLNGGARKRVPKTVRQSRGHRRSATTGDC